VVVLRWVYAIEKVSEKSFGSPMARGGDGCGAWFYLHASMARRDPRNCCLHFVGWEEWMVREQFAKADIRSVLARLSEKWTRREREKEVGVSEFASGEEQEPTGWQGTGYIRVDREVA
jgi:hypothetical protein